MGVVKPLPQDVASRIAAGEVIERPASVLKELIENAVDSGATKISIEVRGAGKKLLRVVDNGCGMAPEDCRTAFQRHSTSKIATLEDIETLHTFGFRGEALFSIAAVAKVTLASKPQTAGSAWRVDIEGGRFTRECEAPPVDGTAIEVRDLFFNTPARAKFLKSDASERGHLARVVEEAALANPRIGFTYKSETRVTMNFKPHPDGAPEEAMRARAAEVLGPEFGNTLLSTDSKSPDLTVHAFVSPADQLHASRGMQYVLVNRRPVANKTVQQALYRAYEPFRPKNRHPVGVISIDVPPHRVDVNVHPTKREVRFSADSAVYESVTRALSKALLSAKGIPTLDPKPSLMDMPAPRPHAAPVPAAFSAAPAPVAEPRRAYSSAPAAHPELPAAPKQAWKSDTIHYLGQIERTYLVFEANGGVLIIDQHAAQERILFEKLMGEISKGGAKTQKLMLPIEVSLPASALQKVLSKKPRLERIGFEVEAFGKTTLHILAVPEVLKNDIDAKETVERLVEEMTSPGSAVADVRYDATATVACKASVKAHDPLSSREAAQLLADLQAAQDPTCCPHGRPSMLTLNREELARRFKRPGAPPL